MEETILNFIREVGVANAIRLLWGGILAGIVLCIYLALRIVWLNARRGNPAQDAITQAFLRSQQEDTQQEQERWQLIARLAQAEAERDNCRKLLERTDSGGLSKEEERTLRDMVTKLKAENQKLRENQKEEKS